MALARGTRLGPYQIESPIGAGGMGEVYKATDTRLERTVAIKVLPAHVASDPERKQRFEREAKTISSLNHPNICTLHDVGREGDVDFLVMEYLEGETLAQRLTKGALPLDQALKYAIEIADALDKAHRQGVTHRDLKPANIMLTKAGTKLLDFGLAKLKPTGPQSEASTKLADALTQQGTILGTFQYMAPEQLEGKDADARTDVWAFGCVVYEMVTGEKAFEGTSQASLIGAILKDEPRSVSSLQPLSPLALDQVIRICLAKDPDERWQSAGDIGRQLKLTADGSTTQVAVGVAPSAAARSTGWRQALPFALGTSLVVAIVSSLVVWGILRPDQQPAPPAQEVTRFTLNVFPGWYLSDRIAFQRLRGRPTFTSLVLSPDGRHLVYSASDGENMHLYHRPMDQAQATPMPRTDGGSNPFFSPDGRSVGFFVEGQLKRVPVDGGEVQTIAVSGPEIARFGASWTTADTLLVSAEDGVYELPSSGGSLSRLTSAEPDQDERFFYPELLPDGRAVLFNVARGFVPSDWNIVVESLDTGQRHVVVEGGSDPRYVSSGHVLFVRTGTLMAIPFDVGRLEVTGAPVVVAEDVMQSERIGTQQLNVGAGQFSVSGSGSLAYVPGGIYPAGSRQWVWVDRSGAADPLPLPPGRNLFPRFSPDGTRLAYAEGPVGDMQIWVYDIRLEVPVRLTTTVGGSFSPVWSPDGTRLAVAYRTERDGPAQLFWMPADGSGEPQRVTETVAWPSSWSTDGVLAFVQGTDIWTVSLDDGTEPEPFFETPFRETYPAFSPDGRWLAYASNNTGRVEVYVRPFPGGEPVHRVSTAGGSAPLWSPDGRQLFFRKSWEERDRGIMVVDVTTDPTFTRSQPRSLFESREFGGSIPVRSYDLAPDGQRFVMYRLGQADPQPVTGIHVVQNWFTELERLVPVP